MPTRITIKAIEESTYVLVASFSDELGNACVPNTLTWTLTDFRGKVVNNRLNVSITPDTAVAIVLHGEDLVLSSRFLDNNRAVLLRGTYDSTLGSNLEFKDEARFAINDLKGHPSRS